MGYSNRFIYQAIIVVVLIHTLQTCRYVHHCDKNSCHGYRLYECVGITGSLDVSGEPTATILHIYDSNIPEISPGYFRHFNDLKELLMPDNNISYLEPGSFSGVSDLHNLNLANNNIQTIPQGVFNGMYKLSVLDLSHNRISVIESKSFTGTDSLETLYLNDNLISNMMPLADQCRNLIFLELSNNKLSEIQFTRNCFKLEALNVASNILDKFPRDLPKTIKSLDLSDNNLADIQSSDLVNLNGLERLNLSRNPLFRDKDMLVDLFQNITRLVVVPDQQNQVANLPVDYRHDSDWNVLQTRQNLYPMYDDISRDNYQTMKPLKQETHHFENHVPLKVLNLSCTSIKKLNVGIFSQMQALELLDLSSNSLTYLPKGIFHDLKNLQELYVSNNSLSYFDNDGLDSLRKINLNANSWNCDLLSGILKKFKPATIIPGNSYNTTNIRGVACYEEIKDFKKVETYNSSGISDFQKAYLSQIIKTPIDLREMFGQLKNFLEQSGRNQNNYSMDNETKDILIDLGQVLNDTRLYLKSLGNSVNEHNVNLDDILVNLTDILAPLSKLTNESITIKNESIATKVVDAQSNNEKKQIIASLKGILDENMKIVRNYEATQGKVLQQLDDIRNRIGSTKVELPTSTQELLHGIQPAAFKTHPSTTGNRSDTFALYSMLILQLTAFAVLGVWWYRRYNFKSKREDSNTLNSLVI